MKFFLNCLGNWANDYPIIEKAVLKADQTGFDGILMPDHYMWHPALNPGPMIKRPDRNVTLETWTALTYLAAKTANVSLGTMVTPIPFRPPSMLAKRLSTLDVLSNGRVVLGVGAGWVRGEFDGYSEWSEGKTRVEKTKEGIELMIKLWTEDKVNFEGKFYKSKGAILEPKPIQKPHPKLLFGGFGKRMLKLAGKYANIAFIPPPPPGRPFEESFMMAKTLVLKSAEENNRNNEISFAGGEPGPDTFIPEFDLKMISKQIELANNLGAKYYLVVMPRNDLLIKNIESFAKEIIPSFK
jgi:alkanesulfonate monooxygenase SsuD/methylene tetrahydromethanopterin reductase-like flavin-dependent oxidoreductase (luciferase family)